MARQKHDLRVRKRRYASERIERLGFARRRKRRGRAVWLDWCRHRGHPAECRCEYPED